MELRGFLFFSDIISLSTSAEVTGDKKKEFDQEQSSMYRVNTTGEPRTGTASRVLFAIVAESSLNT